MKFRILILLLVVLFAGSARAQTPAPSPSPLVVVDPELFLEAAKPFHKLLNATDIGVNLLDYRRLLIEAKTDFDLPMAKFPDSIQRAELEEAMRDYLLAADAWSFAADNSLYCANRYQPEGMPTKNDFYRGLRARYGEKMLPPPKTQQCNVRYGALLRVMWDMAALRIRHAIEVQKAAENSKLKTQD